MVSMSVVYYTFVIFYGRGDLDMATENIRGCVLLGGRRRTSSGRNKRSDTYGHIP